MIKHNSDSSDNESGESGAETEADDHSKSDDSEYFDEEIDAPMLWIKALNWLITSRKVTIISSDENVSLDMHLIGFKYLVFSY
jgi:U3 small nucleolar RNA-associated protein 14